MCPPQLFFLLLFEPTPADVCTPHARVSVVCSIVSRRSVVVDGLLLRVFDRVRQTAMYGCCDDPACDLQLMLHQFTLRAVERVWPRL